MTLCAVRAAAAESGRAPDGGCDAHRRVLVVEVEFVARAVGPGRGHDIDRRLVGDPPQRMARLDVDLVHLVVEREDVGLLNLAQGDPTVRLCARVARGHLGEVEVQAAQTQKRLSRSVRVDLSLRIN